MIVICPFSYLVTWSLSVMWSMDSLTPTGGTTRATRLPLGVVTVVSSFLTMRTGKDYVLFVCVCVI